MSQSPQESKEGVGRHSTSISPGASLLPQSSSYPTLPFPHHQLLQSKTMEMLNYTIFPSLAKKKGDQEQEPQASEGNSQLQVNGEYFMLIYFDRIEVLHYTEEQKEEEEVNGGQQNSSRKSGRFEIVKQFYLQDVFCCRCHPKQQNSHSIDGNQKLQDEEHEEENDEILSHHGIVAAQFFTPHCEHSFPFSTSFDATKEDTSSAKKKKIEESGSQNNIVFGDCKKSAPCSRVGVFLLTTECLTSLVITLKQKNDEEAARSDQQSQGEESTKHHTEDENRNENLEEFGRVVCEIETDYQKRHNQKSTISLPKELRTSLHADLCLGRQSSSLWRTGGATSRGRNASILREQWMSANSCCNFTTSSCHDHHYPSGFNPEEREEVHFCSPAFNPSNLLSISSGGLSAAAETFYFDSQTTAPAATSVFGQREETQPQEGSKVSTEKQKQGVSQSNVMEGTSDVVQKWSQGEHVCLIRTRDHLWLYCPWPRRNEGDEDVVEKKKKGEEKPDEENDGIFLSLSWPEVLGIHGQMLSLEEACEAMQGPVFICPPRYFVSSVPSPSLLLNQKHFSQQKCQVTMMFYHSDLHAIVASDYLLIEADETNKRDETPQNPDEQEKMEIGNNKDGQDLMRKINWHLETDSSDDDDEEMEEEEEGESSPFNDLFLLMSNQNNTELHQAESPDDDGDPISILARQVEEEKKRELDLLCDPPIPAWAPALEAQVQKAPYHDNVDATKSKIVDLKNSQKTKKMTVWHRTSKLVVMAKAKEEHEKEMAGFLDPSSLNIGEFLQLKVLCNRSTMNISKAQSVVEKTKIKTTTENNIENIVDDDDTESSNAEEDEAWCCLHQVLLITTTGVYSFVLRQRCMAEQQFQVAADGGTLPPQCIFSQAGYFHINATFDADGGFPLSFYPKQQSPSILKDRSIQRSTSSSKRHLKSQSPLSSLIVPIRTNEATGCFAFFYLPTESSILKISSLWSHSLSSVPSLLTIDDGRRQMTVHLWKLQRGREAAASSMEDPFSSSLPTSSSTLMMGDRMHHHFISLFSVECKNEMGKAGKDTTLRLCSFAAKSARSPLISEKVVREISLPSHPVEWANGKEQPNFADNSSNVTTTCTAARNSTSRSTCIAVVLEVRDVDLQPYESKTLQAGAIEHWSAPSSALSIAVAKGGGKRHCMGGLSRSPVVNWLRYGPRLQIDGSLPELHSSLVAGVWQILPKYFVIMTYDQENIVTTKDVGDTWQKEGGEVKTGRCYAVTMLYIDPVEGEVEQLLDIYPSKSGGKLEMKISTEKARGSNYFEEKKDKASWEPLLLTDSATIALTVINPSCYVCQVTASGVIRCIPQELIAKRYPLHPENTADDQAMNKPKSAPRIGKVETWFNVVNQYVFPFGTSTQCDASSLGGEVQLLHCSVIPIQDGFSSPSSSAFMSHADFTVIAMIALVPVNEPDAVYFFAIVSDLPSSTSNENANTLEEEEGEQNKHAERKLKLQLMGCILPPGEKVRMGHVHPENDGDEVTDENGISKKRQHEWRRRNISLSEMSISCLDVIAIRNTYPETKGVQCVELLCAVGRWNKSIDVQVFTTFLPNLHADQREEEGNNKKYEKNADSFLLYSIPAVASIPRCVCILTAAVPTPVVARRVSSCAAIVFGLTEGNVLVLERKRRKWQQQKRNVEEEETDDGEMMLEFLEHYDYVMVGIEAVSKLTPVSPCSAFSSCLQQHRSVVTGVCGVFPFLIACTPARPEPQYAFEDEKIFSSPSSSSGVALQIFALWTDSYSSFESAPQQRRMHNLQCTAAGVVMWVDRSGFHLSLSIANVYEEFLRSQKDQKASKQQRNNSQELDSFLYSTATMANCLINLWEANTQREEGNGNDELRINGNWSAATSLYPQSPLCCASKLRDLCFDLFHLGIIDDHSMNHSYHHHHHHHQKNNTNNNNIFLDDSSPKINTVSFTSSSSSSPDINLISNSSDASVASHSIFSHPHHSISIRDVKCFQGVWFVITEERWQQRSDAGLQPSSRPTFSNRSKEVDENDEVLLPSEVIAANALLRGAGVDHTNILDTKIQERINLQLVQFHIAETAEAIQILKRYASSERKRRSPAKVEIENNNKQISLPHHDHDHEQQEIVEVCLREVNGSVGVAAIPMMLMSASDASPLKRSDGGDRPHHQGQVLYRFSSSSCSISSSPQQKKGEMQAGGIRRMQRPNLAMSSASSMLASHQPSTTQPSLPSSLVKPQSKSSTAAPSEDSTTNGHHYLETANCLSPFTIPLIVPKMTASYSPFSSASRKPQVIHPSPVASSMECILVGGTDFLQILQLHHPHHQTSGKGSGKVPAADGRGNAVGTRSGGFCQNLCFMKLVQQQSSAAAMRRVTSTYANGNQASSYSSNFQSASGSTSTTLSPNHVFVQFSDVRIAERRKSSMPLFTSANEEFQKHLGKTQLREKQDGRKNVMVEKYPSSTLMPQREFLIRDSRPESHELLAGGEEGKRKQMQFIEAESASSLIFIRITFLAITEVQKVLQCQIDMDLHVVADDEFSRKTKNEKNDEVPKEGEEEVFPPQSPLQIDVRRTTFSQLSVIFDPVKLQHSLLLSSTHHQFCAYMNNSSTATTTTTTTSHSNVDGVISSSREKMMMVLRSFFIKAVGKPRYSKYQLREILCRVMEEIGTE